MWPGKHHIINNKDRIWCKWSRIHKLEEYGKAHSSWCAGKKDPVDKLGTDIYIQSTTYIYLYVWMPQHSRSIDHTHLKDKIFFPCDGISSPNLNSDRDCLIWYTHVANFTYNPVWETQNIFFTLCRLRVCFRLTLYINGSGQVTVVSPMETTILPLVPVTELSKPAVLQIILRNQSYTFSILSLVMKFIRSTCLMKLLSYRLDSD